MRSIFMAGLILVAATTQAIGGEDPKATGNYEAFGCGTGQFDLDEKSAYCVGKRAAESGKPIPKSNKPVEPFGCGTGQFDLDEKSDYCVHKRAAEALQTGAKPVSN